MKIKSVNSILLIIFVPLLCQQSNAAELTINNTPVNVCFSPDGGCYIPKCIYKKENTIAKF